VVEPTEDGPGPRPPTRSIVLRFFFLLLLFLLHHLCLRRAWRQGNYFVQVFCCSAAKSRSAGLVVSKRRYWGRFFSDQGGPEGEAGGIPIGGQGLRLFFFSPGQSRSPPIGLGRATNIEGGDGFGHSQSRSVVVSRPRRLGQPFRGCGKGVVRRAAKSKLKMVMIEGPDFRLGPPFRW